jgi:hypothetical protein
LERLQRLQGGAYLLGLAHRLVRHREQVAVERLPRRFGRRSREPRHAVDPLHEPPAGAQPGAEGVTHGGQRRLHERLGSPDQPISRTRTPSSKRPLSMG